MRTAVTFSSWGISEEYVTNKETDWKEEHERSPDDVKYHQVDEHCRKNSQELKPRANEQCREKSHEPFSRRDILYHKDYHEAKKY